MSQEFAKKPHTMLIIVLHV